MAERLVTLPDKQVAWVQFPVPARRTFCVENVHLSLYRTTFVVLPAGQVGSSAENTTTAQAGAAHWGLGYS
jgi:hypothetical protein